MSAYLHYFRIQLVAGLQYKAAALSGIATQFFWGIMYIFLYSAFYSATNSSMSLDSLITYVWLNQALMGITYFYFKDADITSAIKSGNIAYEITRPYNLYFWWYFKVLAKKYASVSLRFLPIIIVSLFLPAPYNLSLPYSSLNFILFLVSFFLGSLVIVGILMLIHLTASLTFNSLPKLIKSS